MKFFASLLLLLRRFTLLLFLVCELASAQPALPELVVWPRNVPPGVTTQVMVTWTITDLAYLAGSAVLNEIGNDNRVVRRLATFVDDGTAGDEVAGDKKLTARFQLSEPSERVLKISASAAFRGALLRGTSPIGTVFVNSDTDRRLGWAILDDGKLVFRDTTGSVVSSLPLASYEESSVKLPEGQATLNTLDRVMVADSQQRAAVFTKRTIQLDSFHEGNDTTSSIRYFSSSGELLFSMESSPGTTFFIDPSSNFLSRTGDRLLLIETAENETDPTVKLVDQFGIVVRQWERLTGLAVIREAHLSNNGRYIGLVGWDSAGGNETVTFIDTSSFAITQRIFDPFTSPPINISENSTGLFNLLVGDAVVEQLP